MRRKWYLRMMRPKYMFIFDVGNDIWMRDKLREIECCRIESKTNFTLERRPRVTI